MEEPQENFLLGAPNINKSRKKFNYRVILYEGYKEFSYKLMYSVLSFQSADISNIEIFRLITH